MSGRSPAELAREVRDVMELAAAVAAGNLTITKIAAASAFLAELQAKAEAGQRLALHMMQVAPMHRYDCQPNSESGCSCGLDALRKEARTVAAAAPSPADQEEA